MAASDNPTHPDISSSAAQVNAPKHFHFLDYLYICFGLITVASIVLAYYWHAQSVQERAPAYYVSPERTRIVEMPVPAPSEVQVLYRGKALNTNVNAVVVYLWNDGKLPIKREDVLEPVRLQLEPGAEILDARVLKVSRAVTKFAEGEVGETAKNVLPLSFTILERGDGAALQIIYAGKPDATVSVMGTIVGASQVRSVTNVQKSQKGRRSELVVFLRVWFVTLVMIALAVLTRTRRRLSQEVPMRHRIMRSLVLATLALIMAIGATYNYDRTFAPVVPQSIWASEQ